MSMTFIINMIKTVSSFIFPLNKKNIKPPNQLSQGYCSITWLIYSTELLKKKFCNGFSCFHHLLIDFVYLFIYVGLHYDSCYSA